MLFKELILSKFTISTLFINSKSKFISKLLLQVSFKTKKVILQTVIGIFLFNTSNNFIDLVRNFLSVILGSFSTFRKEVELVKSSFISTFIIENLSEFIFLESFFRIINSWFDFVDLISVRIHGLSVVNGLMLDLVLYQIRFKF